MDYMNIKKLNFGTENSGKLLLVKIFKNHSPFPNKCF